MPTAQDVLKQLAALAGERDNDNNTTVNRYFGAPGQAYCGYALWYAAKKAGSDIFANCPNPAYVPTIKSSFAARRVSNSDAQPGDIFAYEDAHVGFVYQRYSGNTVITLEGNSTIYPELETAKASNPGTGAYEGIGFKKRTLSSSYTVYRPAYDDTPAPDPSDDDDDDPMYALDIKRPLLKKGAVGEWTRKWQTLLVTLGYDVGSAGADGKFGIMTKAATVSFQKDHGLDPDAEAGPLSWAAAYDDL